METQVRDTLPSDLVWCADNMRQSDREEIAAQSGSAPLDALIRCKVLSPYCKTATVGGVPFLMFGVAPSDTPEVGVPWMLATDLLQNKTARYALARQSRQWVDDMQSQFPILANITDVRNKAHHQWLTWCGFKFIRKFNHGPSGAPFYEFVRI